MLFLNLTMTTKPTQLFFKYLLYKNLLITLTLSMLFLVTMREGMIFIFEGLFKKIWNTKYIRHSVNGLYCWGKTLCRNWLSKGKWIGKIECWCKVDSLLFWMKMSEKGHEELVLDNRIWYYLALPWYYHDYFLSYQNSFTLVKFPSWKWLPVV